MSEASETIQQNWKRVLDALERAERAGAEAIVRRTAAETETPAALASDVPPDPALTAENESLKAELKSRDQTISELRREAARLAGLVDNALTQLDLIKEG